jgi:hypothetical protein
MPNPECTDRIWLTNMVLGCVTDWFVQARIIASAGSFDPTQTFTAYGVTFPTFNELCDSLTGKDDGTPGTNGSGSINAALAASACGRTVVLPGTWRLAHQNDVINDFVTAVVDLILNPPATGAGV